MKAGSPAVPDVLRGVRLEGAPLRLGRARASGAVSPAAQGLDAEPAEEEQFRQARALALRQAHEEGLRSGRAEGLREGRAQAAEEVRQAVLRVTMEAALQREADHERLQRIARHAQSALADLLWAAQDEIVALCFETTCRIVGASAVEPRAIRAQLAHLLAQHGAPEVVLHVHPQDAELLQAGASAGKAARIVADPEVALGGCILRTDAGALDARLDAMLEACKVVLREARVSAEQQRRPGEVA
jgi:flagellar assembly protein FliH